MGKVFLSFAAFAAFFVCSGPSAVAEDYQRLNINSLSREELLALEMLTPFQVESILEYRSKYGDILSSSELMAIDGFVEENVEALAAVLLFEPSPPSEGRRTRQVITARVKKPFAKDGFATTAKYCLTSGKIGVGAVIDNDPGEKFPDFVSAFASFKGFVAGDFRARFGQGLAVWKGMSFNSLGEPSALAGRESGITPYTSSDEENYLRGVGWSGKVGATSLNAFASVKGKSGAVNASRVFGRWKIGSTAVCGVDKYGHLWANGGVDFYGSAGHLRCFGELATNERLAPAVKLGALWRPVYELEAGWKGWIYAPAYTAPQGASSLKDQIGTEAAVRYTFKRWKFNANVQCRWKPSSAQWSFKYRIAAQYDFAEGSSLAYHFRNGQHRFNFKWAAGPWSFGCRAEGNLSGYGFFGEASYREPRLEVTARITYYDTDGWNSRIYLYERNLPQSFSTMAYYGKGTGAYLVVKYAPVRWCELWFKLQQNYCSFFTRITIPG